MRVAAPWRAPRAVAAEARLGAGDAVGPRRGLLAAHPDLALLVLLAVIALVPRVVLQLQAPIFLDGDSASYVQPAWDLVRGRGVTNALKRPIGYPLLLAAVFRVSGPDLMAIAAVQHALGIVTVGLTYALGRTCFNRGVGFGAAILVGISGPQLVYEQTPLTESLSTLLLLALALVLIRATRATTVGPALLAGLLLGLTALVKPAAQSLAPFALALVALGPVSRRRRLAAAGALAGAFALVVTPWMLRNLAVHGRFSVGGGLGESLLASTTYYSRGVFVFDGPRLPPESDPTRAAARRIIQEAVDQDESERSIVTQIRTELGLGERDADRLVQQLVVEVIARQPEDFFGRVPQFIRSLYEGGQRSHRVRWDSYKIWREERREEPALQRFVRSPTNAQEAARPRVEALLGFYQPSRLGLALPMGALIGLAATWRVRPPAAALVPGLLGLAWVLAHVTMDGPQARYRYPVEPFLNVLALGAIWIAVRRAASLWRRRRGTARTP